MSCLTNGRGVVERTSDAARSPSIWIMNRNRTLRKGVTPVVAVICIHGQRSAVVVFHPNHFRIYGRASPLRIYCVCFGHGAAAVFQCLTAADQKKPLCVAINNNTQIVLFRARTRPTNVPVWAQKNLIKFSNQIANLSLCLVSAIAEGLTLTQCNNFISQQGVYSVVSGISWICILLGITHVRYLFRPIRELSVRVLYLLVNKPKFQLPLRGSWLTPFRAFQVEFNNEVSRFYCAIT